MKKYKLKESVKNVIAIMFFYGIIIFGVIALNVRFEQIEKEQPQEVTQNATQQK